MNKTLEIREFRIDDGPACLALFRDTIRRVNCRDYNPQQIAAWSAGRLDSSQFAERLNENTAFVAVADDRVVGFADLTSDGNLDRLFVSADHQRLGIGRRLVQTLVDEARQRQMACIATDASITAKPFFQAQGFQVISEQAVDCRGVMLSNYHMRRPADPA